MDPPQKPTSIEHLPVAAAFLIARDSTFTVGGMLLSGISITVVIPPAAAALVADSKPSHSVRPGSLICTCESTRPGIRAPEMVTSSAACTTSLKPTIFTIFPALTHTAAGLPPISVMTCCDRTTRSNCISQSSQVRAMLGSPRSHYLS